MISIAWVGHYSMGHNKIVEDECRKENENRTGIMKTPILIMIVERKAISKRENENEKDRASEN